MGAWAVTPGEVIVEVLDPISSEGGLLMMLALADQVRDVFSERLARRHG